MRLGKAGVRREGAVLAPPAPTAAAVCLPLPPTPIRGAYDALTKTFWRAGFWSRAAPLPRATQAKGLLAVVFACRGIPHKVHF